MNFWMASSTTALMVVSVWNARSRATFQAASEIQRDLTFSLAKGCSVGVDSNSLGILN